MQGYAWELMIGMFTPVVPFIYRKEITSQRMSLLRLTEGFEGDGRLQCLYKTPGQDEIKKLFNLTWREVRSGVENSYARVGTWFPLSGQQQKEVELQ
jgi:hypothetical protein